MKKVYIFPPPLLNSYVENLCADFRAMGYDAHTGTYRRVPRGFRSDTVVVSWFENAMFKGGRPTVYGVFASLMKLLFLHARFRRVVLVRHNIVPHGASVRWKWLVDFFYKFCDEKVAHNYHEDYRPIPHPRYRADAGDCSCDGGVVPLAQPGEIAIFGRIVAYKRYEAWFDVLPEDRDILVFGEAPDKTYLEQLQTVARSRRGIRIVDNQPCDRCAAAAITSCGTVFVANDNERALVSGSLIFSLELPVTILVPAGKSLGLYGHITPSDTAEGLGMAATHPVEALEQQATNAWRDVLQ